MSSIDCIDPCDVAIVGGGFAGIAAARVLARRGLSVVVFELNQTPRHTIRAEKLSNDQVSTLRSLWLTEPLDEATPLAGRAISIRGRAVIDRPVIAEHSLRYADMLRLLRAPPSPNVQWTVGRVSSIESTPDRQTLQLADGRRATARLAVLATGHARGLLEALGIERRIVHPVPTISIGFTLRRRAGEFPFFSLTAYGERTGDGVDYSTLFPIGRSMRVNVYLSGHIGEPRVLAFKSDPLEALFALQPGLRPWLDDCEAADRAELFAMQLSICDRVVKPGVVLIGDAYRTSCPGVGDGLSRLLCDVGRLAVHVDDWMKTPGMGEDKIASFYADPIKRSSDATTHRLALRRRRALLDATLTNRIRRSLHFSRRRLVDRLTVGRPYTPDVA